MKIIKTGVKELDDYINEVLDDNDLKYYNHGKLIRLSVIRFFKFLERDDIEFRANELKRIMFFFSNIPVWDNHGYYAKLFDFQIFQVANILCLYYKPYFNENIKDANINNPEHWVRNKRVFEEWYDEIARKNSKTAFSTLILLYQLIFDNYEGKENVAKGLQCFLSATTGEQAQTAWKHLKGYVKQIDNRGRIFRPVGNEINFDEKESFIRVLTGNADTKDSLKPFCSIIDEYHAHKTRDMYDVLSSGTGGLLNPLIIIITTAGTSLTSPCYELRNECLDILDEIKTDDSRFISIYEMDEEDEWQDKTKWIKANPALGQIPNFDLKYLIKKGQKAKNQLSARSGFITKNLNRWVDSASSWVPFEKWQEATDVTIDFEKYRGRKCYAGMDLASTQDFTAFVYVFPKDENDFSKGVDIIPLFFLPHETMKTRSPYIQTWAEQGYINVIPGNTFEYEYLLEEIERIREKYDINPIISYDDWETSQVIPKLNEQGFETNSFAQTVKDYNEPVKTGERLILNGKINHNGNPVLGWMVRNVIMVSNANGFVRPDKRKSPEKIDGVVALLMGLAEYLDDYVSYEETSIRYL